MNSILGSTLLIALLFPGQQPEAGLTRPGSQVQPQAPAAAYTIQPGDVLDIKFFYNPELSEHVVVRPDGRITLQLAKEVLAAGLTPEQLTRSLTDRYSQDLAHPEIAVFVRELAPERSSWTAKFPSPES